ncbi:hypothetical protein [Agriterribacter sp.]|uniref:hypothetical protein n=1 Tax=Agriterribacter sp. TaxID=2821509 RepID=UPI002C3B15D0|nr:hypothetical protein [Agriterribacter sp.]HTN08483.1 hypothetical protein [Agriterribacter sp.]
MTNKKLTHIVGTFLIQAEGSFLNGSTSEKDGKNTVTVPKTLREFKDDIPYVSAQAWRRWLRDTCFEEYNDPRTPIETTQSGDGEGESKDKFTTKKVGVAIDPIEYAEHDIFGYMNSKEGQGTGGVKATIRSSPFQSSILLSVRKTGWQGEDKGFVHPQGVAISLYEEALDEVTKDKEKFTPETLKKIEDLKMILKEDISREELVKKLLEGLNSLQDEKEKELINNVVRKITLTVSSSLPYTTRFYNTHLQGVFGLAYHRVGLYRNAGDREELEQVLVDKYLKEDKIEKSILPDKYATIYELKDKSIRLSRTEKILKSLAVLRGGAKQAQFGTDVSPKVLIVAGLSSGNLIFNDLFEDTKEIVTTPREDKGYEVIESEVIGGTRIKLDTLKQILWDYKDRLVTPVYVGIRCGYLSKSNEKELSNWINEKDEIKKWKDCTSVEKSLLVNTPQIVLCSPIEAIDKLIEEIKKIEQPKSNDN